MRKILNLVEKIVSQVGYSYIIHPQCAKGRSSRLSGNDNTSP